MVQQYVVDASVLIQAFVRDKDTPRVRTLLHSAFQQEPTILHVPEFCLLECANVL